MSIKKCKVCNKLLREKNKSNLCSYHYCIRYSKTKVKCSLCGENCNGNRRIRIRKNKDYVVCSRCFVRYEFTPVKQLRELIKESKVYLK